MSYISVSIIVEDSVTRPEKGRMSPTGKPAGEMDTRFSAEHSANLQCPLRREKSE